jgi:CBS domain containing-hemolysin-like protein
MEIITQVILVILLILLNSFFAASEYAIVALRSTRVEELVKRGDVLARLIRNALLKKEDFISATQLGTTIVSLVLGWVGAPVFEHLLFSLFSFLPRGMLQTSAHLISVVLAFLLLTFVSILIGELVPKNIAIQRAEIVALVLIAPLTLFVKAFHPFIILLKNIGNKTLHILGFDIHSQDFLPYSKEEFKLLFDQISDSGIIAKDELRIVDNVFKLSDKNIKQMMTPRSEILTVNAHLPLEKIKTQLDPRYSRFPVYKGNLDNIIGFIHIKDIFHLDIESNKGKEIGETLMIRKIMSVPETKKASEVLSDMQKLHVHLAVVYDEFGVMVGVVTLEDIIESLVGEIQDEFDKPILNIKRNTDGTYLVEGNVPLEKIQKRFHLPIKGQGFTTIGGLIFGLIGREPHVGDKIWISNKVFEVKSVEGKRIKELVIKMNGIKNEVFKKNKKE